MGSFAQKQALQKSAGIKLAVAIGCLAVGFMLTRFAGNSPVVILSLPLFLVAIVGWYWGLGQYCVSKGYSGVLALAGLLGLFGLLLILVLPDKYKLEAPPVMENAYPRPAPGSVTTIV